MEAKLNIYADCSTEEPTKTYVCRRLLLKVSKKVSALAEGLNEKSAQEQEQATIEIIKTIFPDFEDKDFDYLDPVEWLEFVNQITAETNKILSNAEKN